MVQARLIATIVLVAAVVALPDLWPHTTANEPEVEIGEAPEAAEWRHFNERCASVSLKTLTPAEADFQANDRDWDHVNDFWTIDVKGLYTMTSTAERP